MKPLYLQPTVRQTLGGCLRPGGEALTRRMVDSLRPAPGDLILDAGCGGGSTLQLMHRAGWFRVVGVDLDTCLLKEASRKGGTVAAGDLAALPFRTSSVDMVVCECAWNLSEKAQALAEFARVLRPQGWLGMTDIFFRNRHGMQARGSWPKRSCFAQATGLAQVVSEVEKQGFTLMELEDHSQLLRQTAAQCVFAHGSLRGFWETVTGCGEQAAAVCTASAASLPGMFLLTAQWKKYEPV